MAMVGGKNDAAGEAALKFLAGKQRGGIVVGPCAKRQQFSLPAGAFTAYYPLAKTFDAPALHTCRAGGKNDGAVAFPKKLLAASLWCTFGQCQRCETLSISAC